MSSRLKVGTVLKEQYEIARVFGSGKDRAAYLATDLFSLERVLVWESTEVFSLRSKPPGIREYFQVKGKHYLALNLEGQTLAFMVTTAGQIDDTSAALWMYQICQSVGYWHNLESSSPLICLSKSSLTLSAFMLSTADKVMVPAFGVFGEGTEPVLPADSYRFSAPETGEDLAPYSDVYALGGMLYCLLTGQPPPDPEARLTRKAKLKPVRKLNRSASRKLTEIANKALQLNPKKRYPTAAEMAADLAKLVDPSQKSEPKRNKLGVAKYVPIVATMAFFACLFLAYLTWSDNMPNVKLPRFRKGSVPWGDSLDISFLDLPFGGEEQATPTPSPFSISEVVVNQVIVDHPPQIVAYASVLDDAREPILGIPPGQFRAKQDDVNVANITIQPVKQVQDPLTLVVVMDVSGSMLGEPLDKAKAAAATFVQNFGAQDAISLIKFDHEIELVHGFTTDKTAIIGAINTLSPRGDTALYDVLAQSVAQLEGREGRRAIVILTDGRDTASTSNTDDSVIAMASADSVPVFVVGLDSEQFTPEIMEQIGARTGGDYFFAANPDDVQALYKKIRGQLQNQYRLEFASVQGADGNLHILKVGVVHGVKQETWGQKRYRAP